MRLNSIIYLLIGVLVFSCSSDDGSTPEPSIVGSWNATSFTTSLLFDFNGDGEESNDIISELECYTSHLALSEDGTFSSSTSDLIITQTGDSFTGECGPSFRRSGTYTYDNGVLTTVNSGQTITSMVNFTATELTLSAQDQDFGNVVVTYRRN
ncbi:MAG: DUF5004 domain-containing protein [Aurantibacter sp.]